VEIEQFLEELKDIDFEVLDREQQESFRTILLDNGLFEEALKLSEIIYNQNKEEDTAIEGYVHNLLYLDKKDDALVVLYNSPKTPAVLYQEGLIYKEDELFEIAEEKFIRAKELTDFNEAIRALDKELVAIYLETGREEKAKVLSEKIYHEEPSLGNFRVAFDNLIALGLFEEAIRFYKDYGKDYEEPNILFAAAFAYNQIQDLENSKMSLLKTIAVDPDFSEAYLHLGHMSKGEEAKNYLEKYISLQGMTISAYLHLISLYKEDKEYDKIRNIMQDVVTSMGISEETLFISINALKALYEYSKIYDLYNQHAIIKDDPILLGASLSALSEEEDYIDFVEEEAVTYFEVLHDEPTYSEILNNVYELTGSSRILEIINHFKNHHGPHGHHH
jgi:slei family protein